KCCAEWSQHGLTSVHLVWLFCLFFFSSRRRHTRSKRDWSSDVCSSDLHLPGVGLAGLGDALQLVGSLGGARLHGRGAVLVGLLVAQALDAGRAADPARIEADQVV